MLRRALVLVALLCLGCSAQAPVPGSDLNRRIERTVRYDFKVPAYVQLSVSAPKASEFPNYGSITVTFAVGDKQQTRDFLLSKDGKTTVVRGQDGPDRRSFREGNEQDRPQRPADARQQEQRSPSSSMTTTSARSARACIRRYSAKSCRRMPNLVKVYYKDFPLFQIHPWAKRAAIDSNCLAVQSGDAFWDFADYLHTRGEEISGKRGEQRPLQTAIGGPGPHNPGNRQKTQPRSRPTAAMHKGAAVASSGEVSPGRASRWGSPPRRLCLLTV